ncbi:hypothetical protein Q8A73_022647 [Channa argus]|nr:hypothetical protein Q8A73_022647 [Channa argus]
MERQSERKESVTRRDTEGTNPEHLLCDLSLDKDSSVSQYNDGRDTVTSCVWWDNRQKETFTPQQWKPPNTESKPTGLSECQLVILRLNEGRNSSGYPFGLSPPSPTDCVHVFVCQHIPEVAGPEGPQLVSNSDWEHGNNATYREAVNHLIEEFKLKFPMKIDMMKVIDCKQHENETVVDYHRLTNVFDTHSGNEHPTDLGDSPGPWETHLASHFMRGLLLDTAAGVRKTCMGVDQGARLEDVRRHAIHAQTQSRKKNKRKE